MGDAPTPDDLLALFHEVGRRIHAALAAADPARRRERTDRPTQYAVDLVADDAALDVLRGEDVRVLSEESGFSGNPDAPVTVVLDPVDGSTNCARDIPYWGTSICALDATGALVGLVVNQVTGTETTAVRDRGAWRDGEPITSSGVEEPGDALIAWNGAPAYEMDWKQFRSLGSGALALCDVAAGNVDAFIDSAPTHAPWDYLGGMLACTEAGAVVGDLAGEPLITDDPDARRHIAAAATPALYAAIAARATP
ncbi:MAG: inositol monophosphatase family protein [Acidimicrobiia bacterium]